MSETTESGTAAWKRVGIGGTLVAGGLLAGGLIAGTLSANAASNDPQANTSTVTVGTSNDTSPPAGEVPDPSTGAGSGSGEESQPQRSDETLLTGETADRVTAAALAEYPGATILRVETDAGGVYEAHLTTADGDRVTVEVGEDFTVTGTENGPGGMGEGGGHPRSGGSERSPDASPDSSNS
jgi:hypothetical protein